MSAAGYIRDNVNRIEQQISVAAERAGRNRTEIRLMAVTKTFTREYVEQAAACGLTLFGENRVQEMAGKFDEPLPGQELHLIGHLQRNKARTAVLLADCIQSLDKLTTAQVVSQHAAEAGKVMDVLIEINTSGEESKFGLRQEGEYFSLLESLLLLPHLKLRGLMTVGPFSADPAVSRQAFRKLAGLFTRTRERYALEAFSVLSMGMSQDFETAIEEGATLIRLGTALFGRR